MWIGCPDSPVPAEEITRTEPGESFVHPNIANRMAHTNFAMLSVLRYAVEVLKVMHVIVRGHYRCEGVHHAMGSRDLGLIAKRLRRIKDVAPMSIVQRSWHKECGLYGLSSGFLKEIAFMPPSSKFDDIHRFQFGEPA